MEQHQAGHQGSALRAAFPLTVPILAGFLLTGATCGIYATSMGLPWWTPTCGAGPRAHFPHALRAVLGLSARQAHVGLHHPPRQGPSRSGLCTARVYCLKDVNPLAGTHETPEAISIALVVAAYLWRRNMLLSIFAGTALYMVLVNLALV